MTDGIPYVTQVDGVQYQPEDLNRDGIVTQEEVNQYRLEVNHYFDTQMGHDIMNLSQENRDRFFKMVSEYADVLEKILPMGNDLIEHALGKRFATASETQTDVTTMLFDNPIITAYDEWKARTQAGQTA